MKVYLVTTEISYGEENYTYIIPCATKEAALRKLQERIKDELFSIAKDFYLCLVSEDELAKGGYFKYNSETNRYVRLCGEKGINEYLKNIHGDYLDEDFAIFISQESFNYRDAYDFKSINIYISEKELVE